MGGPASTTTRRKRRNLGGLAEAVGKGLFAGAAGTAVVTASMMAEAQLRGRPPPQAAGDAAEKFIGVEPRGEREKLVLANVGHWQYGIAWGAARGIAAALGLSRTTATLAHFGLVWGAAAVLPPALRIVPPPTQWPAMEMGLSALHHLVYAGVVGAACERLDAPSTA